MWQLPLASIHIIAISLFFMAPFGEIPKPSHPCSHAVSSSKGKRFAEDCIGTALGADAYWWTSLR